MKLSVIALDYDGTAAWGNVLDPAVFNRGRVMTMPQGVSKATGLQIALQTLRLSARNTLAIGDAENDHELVRLAEVGVGGYAYVTCRMGTSLTGDPRDVALRNALDAALR